MARDEQSGMYRGPGLNSHSQGHPSNAKASPSQGSGKGAVSAARSSRPLEGQDRWQGPVDPAAQRRGPASDPGEPGDESEDDFKPEVTGGETKNKEGSFVFWGETKNKFRISIFETGETCSSWARQEQVKKLGPNSPRTWGETSFRRRDESNFNLLVR